MATTSQIDPLIQPYLQYGLQQAQRLYQTGGPQYYPYETFVRPTTTTQTGLQALEARAMGGSPLTQAAQQQLQGTIGGQYLGGNPFFQGAFAPAAQAAQQQFESSLGNIASQASRAGRYGGGAMGTLQDRAAGQFAQALAGTAGQLAYQNYADERARQQAATMAAPTMAQYEDLKILLAKYQTEYEKDPIAAMKAYYPLFVAIYLQPKTSGEKYDYSKAKEMVTQINQLPAPTIIGIVNFFLTKLAVSSLGIGTSAPSSNSWLKNWMLALNNYTRRLAFQRHLTAWQMEISKKKITSKV